MDIRLTQNFFLVPAESLLISMSDNMVRMDSVSTDFHLVQTIFWSQHYGHTGYNRLIKIKTMAGMVK